MRVRAAVAVGVGAWVAGVGPGHADEIFFPHLLRSPTVTSIVSVVNIEPSGAPVSARQLRYVYLHKSGAAAGSATDPCLEVTFRRVTSPNDVQTFDVGDRLAPGNLGVLFDDPSLNNDYRAPGQSYSGLAGVAPAGQPDESRAFLLVDNSDLVEGQFPRGRLYGEAVILDFGSGAAWGYRAYNAVTDEALQRDGQLAAGALAGSHTFSNPFETEGEVLNGADAVAGQVPVHLLPDDDFDVRFLVTPVAASRDADASGRVELDELGTQRQSGLRTRVRLTIEPEVAGGVAYDRDENPISGPLEQDVVCVGGVPVRGALLSQGVLNQLKQGGSDGGGWSFFQTQTPGEVGGSTPEAVVLRLDTSRARGARRPALGAAPATAVWLRNGTDRHAAFESLLANPLYDVPAPANVQTWGGGGVPNPYTPLP